MNYSIVFFLWNVVSVTFFKFCFIFKLGVKVVFGRCFRCIFGLRGLGIWLGFGVLGFESVIRDEELFFF